MSGFCKGAFIMADCKITVEEATLDPGTGLLFTRGSWNATDPGCFDPPELLVTVTCGGASYSGEGQLYMRDPREGFWTASVPNVNCQCDGPVTVDVVFTCQGTPPFSCNGSATFAHLCCCPDIQTTFDSGPCDANNKQTFSFDTVITINSSCTFSFVRNFGNGQFGAVHTFTGPGTFAIPTEHASYNAPGTYTSTIQPTQPGCFHGNPVVVSASCAPCHTQSWVATLCRFLAFVFLLMTSIGAVLLLVTPSCTSYNVALSFTGLGLLALAFFFLLRCYQCECAALAKLWGQLTLIIGIVMFMFVPPTFGGSVNCAQPIPLVTPGVALFIAIGMLAAGLSILAGWYTNNKAKCPLTQCSYWCTVGITTNLLSCTNIAVTAIIIVYLVTGAVNGLGLLLAILVAAALAGISSLQYKQFNCQNC
jgi:hypothetical protein